jgi:REP element-mobilizing transposase RayT
MKTFKDTPKRLDLIFPSYDTPIYFITFNTWQRTSCLANIAVHDAFIAYAHMNASQGRCVGRYVIMPDHMHLFIRLNREARLSDFIRLMKQHIGKTLAARGGDKPYWQPGYFDHLIRHSESYAEKWSYVHQNPVRAGLATSPETWPFQGEIERLEV